MNAGANGYCRGKCTASARAAGFNPRELPGAGGRMGCRNVRRQNWGNVRRQLGRLTMRLSGHARTRQARRERKKGEARSRRATNSPSRPAPTAG